jgi:DNA-binding NarL/FixJ family response regulator
MDSSDGRKPPDSTTLTPRQTEVLAALRDGLSEIQIALRLQISSNTVHTHVRSIYSRLRVGTRAQLLSLWARPATASDLF